jgi:hypothetical protein
MRLVQRGNRLLNDPRILLGLVKLRAASCPPGKVRRQGLLSHCPAAGQYEGWCALSLATRGEALKLLARFPSPALPMRQ